jgi:hypothetical protein
MLYDVKRLLRKAAGCRGAKSKSGHEYKTKTPLTLRGNFHILLLLITLPYY